MSYFGCLLRKPKEEKIAIDYLAASIKYYGQKRTSKEKHLFVKTDSWHLHFYDQLRNLFPSVPFILLYRNPMEVVLSQKRQRGMQSVPGIIEPEVFGFSRQQYMKTTLTHIWQKYLRDTIKK